MTLTHGAELLKAWAGRSGLKQYEVAERIEVTAPYLCQMLQGKRRPSLPIAIRIHRATGVPVDAWMAKVKSGSDRGRKHRVELTNVSGL